jgi:hypothetical protein
VAAIPFLRRQYRRFLLLFYVLLFTLAITFAMNLVMDGLDAALLFTVRLAAVSLFSIIFCIAFTLRRLKIALQYCLRPLALFSEEAYRRIVMILNIGISLIPVVSQQFLGISQSLKAKGMVLRPRNVLKNPTLLVNVLMYWFMGFVDELERSLASKGV